MADLKYYLSISFHEHSYVTAGPRFNVGVQVWNGEEHVKSFTVLEDTYTTFPEALDIDSIEHFAAVSARIVARTLEDNFMGKVEAGTLITRESIEHNYVRVSDSTK